MSLFWPMRVMIGERFIQRREMGIIAMKRMIIMRCKERESRSQFLLPYAWLQTGSRPEAKPTRTEYPVMFVNPIDNAPPASSKLPRWPRKRTETTARTNTNMFIAVIGITMLHSSFSSSITCVHIET